MLLNAKRCAVLLACTVLVASIAVSAAGQGMIRLEMKPGVGDFVRYDTKMNLEVKVEGDFSFAPEQVRAILANPIQLSANVVSTQKVKDVMDNGDFAMSYGMEKIELSAMGMTFDAAQFMPKEAMAGMPDIVMTKRGTLAGFMGPDGKMMTFGDMMKMMPGGAMPADMPPEAKEMMGKVGDMLEGLIGAGGYPDKELAVGDSWKTPGLDKIMAFLAITDVQDTNTLKAIQPVDGAECAVVDTKGSVQFDVIDMMTHFMKSFGIEAMVKEKGGEKDAAEFAKVLGFMQKLDVPVKGEGAATMMVRLKDGFVVDNKGTMNAVIEAKNLSAIKDMIKAEAGEDFDESQFPKIGESYKVTITGKIDMKMASDQNEPEG
jgi:hypothetical protein